jgi:hypothetical protein
MNQTKFKDFSYSSHNYSKVSPLVETLEQIPFDASDGLEPPPPPIPQHLLIEAEEADYWDSILKAEEVA